MVPALLKDYIGVVKRACLLIFAIVAAACEPPRRPDHESTAIAYVDAVRNARCGEAFSLLTSELQNALRLEAAASAHEGAAQHDLPSRFYCYPPRYDRVDLKQTRTNMVHAGVAHVLVVEVVPTRFLVPGFWPTKHEAQPMVFVVRQESGTWRVEPPALREELAAVARSREARRQATEHARQYNERLFGRR